MSLLIGADLSTIDTDKLGKMMEMQAAWEARDAKRQFNVALSEFQSIAPIIEKGDDAHGKKYARMDRIWRTVREPLARLGLSCTWQVCTVKDNMCHVEGQLNHVSGHSIPLAMDVALPAMVPGQNAAQQVGSARTYAQRYAFCAALGIQTGEDDDAAALSQKITPAMVANLKELLEGFGKSWEAERDALLAWREVQPLKLENLLLSDFELAKTTIARKLDKLKKAEA